jgi:hypothetical protein
MTDQEDLIPVSKGGRYFASESSNRVPEGPMEQSLGTVSGLIAMAQCVSQVPKPGHGHLYRSASL